MGPSFGSRACSLLGGGRGGPRGGPGALPSDSGGRLTLVTWLPPRVTGTPSHHQGLAAPGRLPLCPEPVALALVFSGLPRPGLAPEKEEPLSVLPAWSLRPREGKAAGQALINLFLLGHIRQLPEWGRDPWADLLMIYGLVFRPGTRGTGLSRPLWRIFPASIRAGEVGDQAAGCQPPPPGCLRRPEQAQGMEQWSGEGVRNGPG